MPDLEFEFGFVVHVRTLRQIELPDSLVLRLVDRAAEIDADGLSAGELMLDARRNADSVGWLLDQAGIEAARRRGANHLVVRGLGTVDADRHARSPSHEWPVQGP